MKIRLIKELQRINILPTCRHIHLLGKYQPMFIDITLVLQRRTAMCVCMLCKCICSVKCNRDTLVQFQKACIYHQSTVYLLTSLSHSRA